ncbi:ankyrin repeat domain-containing protein [Wolbachia endosymbiont of Pentalonia nigronervosa]|uniref:ankyrin repeat domain-containing protein n=1 Tax=Wolbachia endosymbiont of Pentalonia nigronervosa TaxID=1301914 RepID=UPI00165EE202|nr:ankyrin repeat domain-containing protein [Wolbachia endosymbiont of Pentalonia nigronervosa]MBD0390910.1 ankyrin repeat domain-containing protein [Wolbachia endosymbiont of Pentalonia nigronervosa]
MNIKKYLLIQAIKSNNKKIVNFTLSAFNTLDKIFSYFKKEKSVRSKDNKYLNDALTYAIKNLKTDIVKLLVNAGADVNSLDKNKRNAITHAVERLAISRNLILDPSKNLPEEIIFHPIIRFLLEKGSEYDHTDEINTKRKHTLVNIERPLPPTPQQKTEAQFMDNKIIYDKIDDLQDTNSLPQEPIYAEVNSAIESKVIEQKRSDMQDKSLEQEPIYAKADFAAKRMAREHRAEDKKSKPVIIGAHLKDGRYVSINHEQSLTPQDKDSISRDSGYISSEEKPEKEPVKDTPCCKKGLVQEGLVRKRINQFTQLSGQTQKIEPETRLTQITHQSARTGMMRG